MVEEEEKTPPVSEGESEDEVSDREDSFDEEDVEAEAEGEGEETGDLADMDTDLSQELAIEDATEFILDDQAEELCDYEIMDQLDESEADQQSHVVSRSATIHTTGYITKYEKTRVLGWRAQHIQSGASPMIREDEKDKDGQLIFKDGKYPREPYMIALKELEFGRCPVIIGRRFPNGEKMMVRVSQLKLI